MADCEEELEHEEERERLRFCKFLDLMQRLMDVVSEMNACL